MIARGASANSNGSDQDDPMGLIVVNYGSHELVEKNLKVFGSAPTNVRIIVVDNFSSATNRDAMMSVAERNGWELISLPSNLGFGLAVNIGAARALEVGCSSLVTLNPDASISPNDLESLRTACLADPFSLISPAVVRPDGSPWFRIGRISVGQGGLKAMTDDQVVSEIGWLSGACLAVNRALWEQLGGFDDDYFLYWEDVDLSFRCRSAGGTLILRDDLRAVHHVGGTQGAAGKSATYYRYNCRNRLIFAGKHLGCRDQARWILHTAQDTREVLNRGGPKQYLHMRAALWPAAAGCLCGLGWLIRLNIRRWLTGQASKAVRGCGTAVKMV